MNEKSELNVNELKNRQKNGTFISTLIKVDK